MIGRPPACSRADLLRAFGRIAGLSDDERALVAEVCGFIRDEVWVDESVSFLPLPPPAPTSSLPFPESSLPSPASPARPTERFWQAYALELRSEDEVEAIATPPPEYAGLEPLRPEDTGRRGAAPPPAPSITPWRRLWPFLRAILSIQRPLRIPTLRRVIPRLALGLPVQRLPLRTRARWSPRLLVLIDLDERLNLWLDDFSALRGRVTQERGDFGASFQPAGAWLAGPECLARTLEGDGLRVLILSDLGCLGEDPSLPGQWARLGRALRRRGIEPWALTPCPAEYLAAEVTGVWRIAEWDGRLPRPTRTQGGLGREARAAALARGRAAAEGLLRWLAPALRIEPGLLRAVRHALPEEGRSVAQEYWAWNHPALAGAGMCARSLQEAEARRWRAELAAGLAGMKDGPLWDRCVAVTGVLRAWHHYCSPAIGWSELALLESVLAAAGRNDEATRERFAPKKVWKEGRDFQRRIVLGMRDGSAAEGRDLAEWADGQCRWLGEAALARPEWRETWVLKDRLLRPGVLPLPQGVCIEEVAWIFELSPQEGAWKLVRDFFASTWVVRSDFDRGQRILLRETLIGRFFSRRRELGLELVDAEGEVTRLNWPLPEQGGGASIPMDTSKLALALDFGAERILAVNARCCSAFVFMGQDPYGLHGDLKLAEDVVLRMRWIPPGRFFMGSQSHEAGRDSDEGPRHEVMISTGFWLAESPVTREQWRALMNDEESNEDDSIGPVTRVSWEQARAFCAELAERHPELVFDLPSEAEWEYACRAGTQSAFNDGSACTVLDGMDPALEALKKHQYPNAWGLREMHGGVWQWCLDGVRRYDDRAEKDPVGAEGGKRRAVRGGAWIFPPRLCRSASRNWSEVGNRDADLGFRLAAGQEIQASDGGRALNQAERDISATNRLSRGVRRARPWAQYFARDEFGVRLEFTLRDTRFVWRWIPRGVFMMGSPTDEPGRWEAEGPQHEVAISRGFWLGATSVTQAQWEAVLGPAANESRFKGAERPVENVDWQRCVDYAGELNRLLPGLGARLPSEAEWEYACRAGTGSAFNDGSTCTSPGGKDSALDALGWYDENSGRQSQAVGQKRANGWGLHDMHGNVWEWCADWWGDRYPSEARTDPTGPENGDYRVMRGGSWRFYARLCRSAYRVRFDSGGRDGDLGFRLAAGQAR